MTNANQALQFSVVFMKDINVSCGNLWQPPKWIKLTVKVTCGSTISLQTSSLRIISLRLKAIAQMNIYFSHESYFFKTWKLITSVHLLKTLQWLHITLFFWKRKKKSLCGLQHSVQSEPCLTHHHPPPHQFFILALFYLVKCPVFPLTTFIHSTHIIEHLQGPRQWLKV